MNENNKVEDKVEDKAISANDLTKDDIKNNPQLTEIAYLVEKLTDICRIEPCARIIYSVSVLDKDGYIIWRQTKPGETI